MKRYKSVARWDSCHGFQDNLTSDMHDTKEQADHVCAMLERDGLGGEKCHFPVKTWVEEIQPIDTHEAAINKTHLPSMGINYLIDKWRDQADRDDVSEAEAQAFGEAVFDKSVAFHKHRARFLRECAAELESEIKNDGTAIKQIDNNQYVKCQDIYHSTYPLYLKECPSCKEVF